MVHIPEVLQAQRLLKDYENLGNIVAFDPAICETPEDLEADAMLGELSKEVIACLEAKLRLERIQSEKSKISLLMINNDMSGKNWESWEFRIRNHLKNIDRSQPDMTFAFAIYLNNKGSEFFESISFF